ncbi:protein LURP-one-related 4-like [Apium graveolens]|uniref:protein LURP-one-related 4-like n=1 Tax=Apium graveolens TaxID=4045 RepID=UPI003D7AFACB
MLKVSPEINLLSPLSSAESTTDHSYTIWMKSLLFNGCGCTIFDSNGEIVYRIDNYSMKCRSQVHLMNLHGKVLLTLRRKKFQIFEQWEGFRWSVSGDRMRDKPWFQVRRDCRILTRSMTNCHVTFGYDHKVKKNFYRIIGFPEKSAFKILRGENQLVAEVKRKQSSSGVILGEDVLSLKVEGSPHIDHLLIMALVIVYGLINDKL